MSQHERGCPHGEKERIFLYSRFNDVIIIFYMNKCHLSIRACLWEKVQIAMAFVNSEGPHQHVDLHNMIKIYTFYKLHT